jgi:hypothetical protein
MSRQLNKWVNDIVTPPARVLIFVAGNIYRLLFGRLELRSSIQREKQLALEIQRDLSFLFDEHSATIVPDERVKHPRPFDYAMVNVALDSFFLRFIRGRGELRVEVAPRRDPRNWSDLFTVLGMVDAQEQSGSKSLLSLEDAARVLKPRVDRLRAAFSDERYAEMERQLLNEHQYDRAVIRQWETEINRRLYPDR